MNFLKGCALPVLGCGLAVLVILALIGACIVLGIVVCPMGRL
jgi:hypothetical protein